MAASDLIPLTLEFTEAELNLLEQAAGGSPPAEWLRESVLGLAAEVCRLAEETEARADLDDEPEEEAPGSDHETDRIEDPAMPGEALAVGIEAEWLANARFLRRGQFEANALLRTILTELYRRQALVDLLDQRSGFWRSPDPSTLAKESGERARERLAKLDRAIDDWISAEIERVD